MFFNSWADLLRIVVVGAPAYLILVVFVRISGKRTLSQLNAFDLIVTVAMGSTLATVLISPEISLAEGVVALGLLIVLQFVITWSSLRSDLVGRAVKATPALLFYRQEFLEGVMRKERVTRGEIRAAARAQGVTDLAAVEAVVLETDGSITVVRPSQSKEISTMLDVRHFPAGEG